MKNRLAIGFVLVFLCVVPVFVNAFEITPPEPEYPIRDRIIVPMEFEGIKPGIIARDEALCPICNQPIENPVVHHIDQDRFNSSPFNLITVCGTSCHHSRGMHDTPNRGKDPHLMVYLQVLAQRRQDYRGVA